jgi:hypothetical protein
MIKLEFTGEDPQEILSNMAKMLGFTKGLSAPAVSGMSSDNEPKTGAQQSATSTAAVEPTPEPQPAKRTRKPKGEVLTPRQPGDPDGKTSTTEVVEPSPPADTFPNPADAIQDAADEAAETETNEADLFTLDDVRNSALPYITKWGKEAAAKDLVPIVMAAGGVPNIGKLDPANQELLKKVMQAFADAAKAETRFAVAS